MATEDLPLLQATGRVLASPLVADRHSPAADVSAMDGYALRMSQLSATEPLQVVGQSVPGAAPPTTEVNSVMKIFTGAVVPTEYDLVVRREDTDEREQGVIRLLDSARRGCKGDNIRRQGENARCGAIVCEPGKIVTAPIVAAAANFGAATVGVTKLVRVAILTTGNELQSINASVDPWQIRDSNGPTLYSLLGRYRHLTVEMPIRVRDEPSELRSSLADALQRADAVFLTGGVSMGDYDYVPETIQACGGEIVFHKLPIRPGKPILGAVGPNGQLIMGLPGNPVSAIVCAERFGVPLLEFMARAKKDPSPQLVTVANPDQRSLSLHWFRLVSEVAPGFVRIVASSGSGDLVSLARSSGFIHLPPSDSGEGPWSFWRWN